MKNLFFGLIALTVVMSIVSFLLMRNDKMRARNREKRISERTLFLTAGFFGAIGGTIGMHLCHHKTNHWEFRTFFPTLMIIQILIIGFVGFRAFG